MKKLITLFMLLCIGCMGVWADYNATYENGVYQFINTGDRRGQMAYYSGQTGWPVLAGVTYSGYTGATYTVATSEAGVNLNWGVVRASQSKHANSYYIYSLANGKFLAPETLNQKSAVVYSNTPCPWEFYTTTKNNVQYNFLTTVKWSTDGTSRYNGGLSFACGTAMSDKQLKVQDDLNSDDGGLKYNPVKQDVEVPAEIQAKVDRAIERYEFSGNGVIANMTDFVGAATSNGGAEVSDWIASEGKVYSFNGQSTSYIGGITDDYVVTALNTNKYVTVAMYVYGIPSGCPFGYGANDDGLKFRFTNNAGASSANVQLTTKGVTDFSSQNLAGMNASDWNLVAFTVPGKANTSASQSMYFSPTQSYNVNYTLNSTGNNKTGMQTPSAANNKFAIGSGNQGGWREGFNGMLANVTVIVTDGVPSLNNIKEYMAEAPTRNLSPELVQRKVDEAMQHIQNSEIGYPDKTNASNLEAIAALAQYQTGQTSVTSDNYTAAYAALNAVYNLTNINLPKDGHMYVLTNIAGDTNKTKHNLYESESGDKIKWSVYENLGSDGDKAKFICRKNGSNFTFVNAKTGHYLVWRGADAGYNNYKGYTEAYDDTYARLNVQRAVYSANNMASATGQEDLFGWVCICGQRPSYSAIDKCFIYSTTGNDNFNQTTNHTEYYSESLSTMFAIEEVPNPNTIKLTNPNKSDEIAKQTLLDKRYVGTFSAPYAVQLSEDVEAYIASVSDNVVTFAKLGNDGHIVPKNTGVLLYAPDATQNITASAVPAISTVTIEDGTNAFVGSNAGSVVMQSGYYVLGKKEAGVGFYPAVVESTLARNKAYLDLSQHQVSAFRFDFEGEGITTDISSVLGLNKQNDGVAYDLAGRRCNINAKGISIIGNKKVIR